MQHTSFTKTGIPIFSCFFTYTYTVLYLSKPCKGSFEWPIYFPIPTIYETALWPLSHSTAQIAFRAWIPLRISPLTDFNALLNADKKRKKNTMAEGHCWHATIMPIEDAKRRKIVDRLCPRNGTTREGQTYRGGKCANIGKEKTAKQ